MNKCILFNLGLARAGTKKEKKEIKADGKIQKGNKKGGGVADRETERQNR